MVLNSVTDFPASLARMEAASLEPRVVEERSLVLRPLFDRAWLDHLGGVARGLYSLRDGIAYETVYAVEARRAVAGRAIRRRPRVDREHSHSAQAVVAP